MFSHRYNGFGGKVDPGETPAQAAARELQVRAQAPTLMYFEGPQIPCIFFCLSQEEAGIEAPLKHAGTFLFLSTGVQWAFQIEIYRADTYTGIPTEWVAFIKQIQTCSA